MKNMPNSKPHPKLIDAVREKLTAWGGVYVIENVEGAKRELKDPVMLCGSMFDLGYRGYQVRRHRFFESNALKSHTKKCSHSGKTLSVYGNKVRDTAAEKRHYSKPKESRGLSTGILLPNRWGIRALGVEWMNIREASQCIPPVYSEYIGRLILSQLEEWRRQGKNEST